MNIQQFASGAVPLSVLGSVSIVKVPLLPSC